MDPFLLPHQAPPPTSTAATPTTTAAAEANPNNHAAPSAPQSNVTPPCDDMIFAAITALNEREGSSKRAIWKYIETNYQNLPPNHSDSLTFHLKRLKSIGLLVMNKKSYMLPQSRSANNDTTTTNNFPANAAAADAVNVAAAASGGGVKRGRGRPPKPKAGVNGLDGVASGGSAQAIVVSGGIGDSGLQDGGSGAAQPLLASLGLTEEVQPLGKRSRGRPKRLVVGAVQGGAAAAVGVKKGRGRPKGMKKGVGRPKKLKTVAGVKKGPGRPPKAAQVNVGAPGFGGAAVSVAPAAAPAAGAGSGNSPKPRGRPKKNADGVGAGGNLGAVPLKRPGRPPKISGGVVKPTGKRVGRPKKNGLGPQQAESYGDIKRKLEFFQSKVMEAVAVLKPQVSNQAPVSVVSAIQELEGLAAMDLNAPLGGNPQLQLPQSQALPQHYFPPQPQLMAQLQLPQPQLMPQQQLPPAQPFLH